MDQWKDNLRFLSGNAAFCHGERIGSSTKQERLKLATPKAVVPLTAAALLPLLRESLGAKSSLKQSWLFFSQRNSCVNAEMLEQALSAKGFVLAEDTIESLIRLFGEGDIITYRGFVKMTTVPDYEFA